MKMKSLEYGTISFATLLSVFSLLLCKVHSQSCDFVDSCTCDMSDGSGRVNLHSLAVEALPGETLADAAFGVFGDDGYTYSYNPCNGFSIYTLTDLAIAQITAKGDLAYDVGVQSKAEFNYTASTGLSIHYSSAVDKRSSRVYLICQPNLNSNVFEFVGELIKLEYDFILTSPCACPGLCDENGLTLPLPTPPPSSGGDVTCKPIDACTCVMTDGSGQVNLHSAAISETLLVDSAFTTLGSDMWYYKFNPCWGFRTAGFTDLAVFQSSDTAGTTGFDLGVQTSITFDYTSNSGLTMKYTALDALRKSRILLICIPGVTEHKFEFLGETVTTEYEFAFTSPCACPGTCNSEGIIGVPVTQPPSSKSCTLLDSCTCEMSDGTGIVNLHSLAMEAASGQTLTDAAFSILGMDGWTYKYNPCNGFTAQPYSDLALLQTNFIDVYDLGVQSSAKFEYADSSGLSIAYQSALPYRTGRVLLVCEPSVNINTFEYLGELTTLEYDFVLSTPCACPGLCDDNGLTRPLSTATPPTQDNDATCNKIDSCTCEMSDGSGIINLHGPALDGSSLYVGGFTVDGGDGWTYSYNPCNGFYSGGHYDLAVYQSQDIHTSWGYDLGVQSSAVFSYDRSEGTSIHYTAAVEGRISKVLLLCVPGTMEHNLEFVGELSSGEYEFIFASPCACPGACDDDGVVGPTPPPNSNTCSKVDSCTCDMSDGSGQVNLRSLALEGNSLYDSAFNVIGSDNHKYKYNPCNGFTYQLYSDLAIAQVGQFESYGYDLGVQSTATFLYETITDSQYSLSIQYQSGDRVRTSRVLLECQPNLNQNALTYVGELTTLEYDFILSSPCTCPGVCNDNGPIIPLPTPGPTPDPGTTCNYVDSCTCEMSDGTGRINLHGPALDDNYLYDSAFTIYGSDGYYYKYNPCQGFDLGGHYDLAVFQTQNAASFTGNDLGVQSSSSFEYTQSNGVSVNYMAYDQSKSSKVTLNCAPGTTEHKFELIGKGVSGEYLFLFTSPCSCPGACDYNGVIGGPDSLPDGHEVCTYVNSCTCDMADGTGRVNLNSLASQGDTEYAFSVVGSDSRLYYYNPCSGFTYYAYDDLAIIQQDAYSAFAYDLGVQSRAQFGYAQSSGLSIHYISLDGIRSSRVNLICQQNLNENKFEYVGELITLEYDFILTTPCACPGYCDDNGPIVTLPTPPPSVGDGKICNFVDSCTCEMSDGTGRINLHGTALEGLSLYDSAFNILGQDGWYYKYNPCNGFSASYFTDLAIFQTDEYGYAGYDLGVQASAYFNYSQASGVSIHYAAADTLRTSRVLLICAPVTTTHILNFLGELVTTEYDFSFTSPCACPGACDDNGVIGATQPPGIDVCQMVDSCTCNMKDGSGQVNLHSLGLEPSLGYLGQSAFSVYATDGWTYKYNPCNGFSYYVYSDLALFQSDSFGSYGFDLGVQSKAYFTYDDAKGLSILYTAYDGLRTSRVLLVCQSEVDSNVFEFVGELIILEYDFILTSPCACPGLCDNDGLINPLPTMPPGGGGDSTCEYVDSCTCEMSDGTGQINLQSLSLQDYYLYDSAFTEYGDDGYYYKYNPCQGFYFQGYYDTAIAQTTDIYGYYGYELGVQSSAKFMYDEASGLTISYKSTDQYRSSRVLLICEPNSNTHRFQVIGQTTASEYEFMLTSPCACPGGCDEDGAVDPPGSTQCTKLDSCTCEMTDGTGRVNLRSIGLKGESLTDAAYTANGLDGWFYKYNPCTEFSLLYYVDLAVGQVNSFETAGHDLGVQRTADFKYSNVDGLSIHYDSGDNIRSSKVLLICDPYAMEAQFEFIGELVTLEYDFILKTVCACPGGCSDFGPVNPIITQSPQGNGGVGDLPDTVHVYVNQSGDHDPSYYFWPDVGGSTIALIFHDIFLILFVAALIYLAKNVPFCRKKATQAKQTFVTVKGTVTGEVAV